MKIGPTFNVLKLRIVATLLERMGKMHFETQTFLLSLKGKRVVKAVICLGNLALFHQEQ